MKLSKNKSALVLAFAAVAAVVAANETLPESVRLVAQLAVTFIAALAIPKP